MRTDDGAGDDQRDPVGPAPLEHRAALRREQDALLAMVTTPAALAARVPACPAWRVHDLLAHLAGVHRWAVAMSRTAPHEPAPGEHVPGGSADVVTEYAAAAAQLRAALAGDRPQPCRTLVGPGTTAWWARRQLHETLVHRVDVEQALARPSGAAEAVAQDTVAEVLDTVLPRQVRLGRAVLPAGVGVDLLAPGARWRLGAPGEAARTASVAGPALVLAQLLWRRTTSADPRLHVDGDVAALQAVLAQPLTP